MDFKSNNCLKIWTKISVGWDSILTGQTFVVNCKSNIKHKQSNPGENLVSSNLIGW